MEIRLVSIIRYVAIQTCVECKFYREKNCVSKMCADILDCIHKLRGEGK